MSGNSNNEAHGRKCAQLFLMSHWDSTVRRVVADGDACLANLECGGHRQKEQPLMLLVEWFKNFSTMRCLDGGGCFWRVSCAIGVTKMRCWPLDGLSILTTQKNPNEEFNETEINMVIRWVVGIIPLLNPSDKFDEIGVRDDRQMGCENWLHG